MPKGFAQRCFPNPLTMPAIQLGTPGGIRTPGLLLRRQLLYPTELLAHRNLSLHVTDRVERVMGIEPTCSAWKADILPLNYTRGFF